MTLRRRRCITCNSLFHSADPEVTECQNCTGTYDPAKARAADAAGIQAVNASRVTTGKHQSVDPRTGKPRTKAPVKGPQKQTASADLVAKATKAPKKTTAKAPKSDAS